MEAPQIQHFLEQLHCSKIKANSTWVKACCPLAPWTHAGGNDKRPSFYVAIDGTNHSGVKCHTCQFKGTLNSLLWRLVSLTSMNLTELFRYVTEHDMIDEESLQERIDKIPVAGKTLEEILPVQVAGIAISPGMFQLTLAKKTDLEVELPQDELLAKFKPLDEEARDWVRSRGFLDQTIDTWELRWHAGARRVAIPVRDVNQKLVCISGRSIDGRHPKFLHSQGFKRDLYLHGEHRCQTHRVGYLVEGFFDVMMLWQKGYRNPLGFMGSYLSSFQIEKILLLCDEVVIVPDGDQAGRDAAERIYKELAPRLRKTRIAGSIDGKDPDELTDAFLRSELGEPQEPPLDAPAIA